MGGPGEGFEYPDAESSPSTSSSSIPGLPKLDSRRVVDGERSITFLKPLPPTSANRRFHLKSRILGVYDKGKATVLTTETSLVDSATNEIYTRAVGSGFFVGQGGWGGPKGPATVSYAPPADRKEKPDAEHEIKLSNEAALLYRLNGDYNPLHATPEPGQKMGFGGTIMHGLFSWNSAAHALLRELGGSDPENMREFQARFANPVRPGEGLRTRMWRMGGGKEGWEEVRFETVVVGSGKVALSNGRAVMRCVGRAGGGGEVKSKL
ncbi:MAG: hypothetical protein Q9227_006896 [Pyrenula ochraceoflavens]